MARLENDLQTMLADKAELCRILSEQNALMGFVANPTATAQKSQAMTLALGIRPEDNIGLRNLSISYFQHPRKFSLAK